MAELPSLPHPGASPGEVLKRLEPVLEEVERREEVKLLERLEEAYPKAAFGPEVLARVQEGRVEVWVLPWHLEQEVYLCQDFAFADEAQALAYCESPEKNPSPRCSLPWPWATPPSWSSCAARPKTGFLSAGAWPRS